MTTNIFELKQERRLCEVDGKLGYFHCWEQYADVIAPSLMQGGHHGGQYSRVFGIIEFEGCIKRVDPTEIQFVDNENHELNLLEKVHKKVKEAKSDIQREAD